MNRPDLSELDPKCVEIAFALQVFNLRMTPVHETIKRLAALSETDFLQTVMEDGSIVTEGLSEVTAAALADLWKVVFDGIPTAPPGPEDAQ